ncbi:MAG: hypothetical protein JEY96_04350 [Bacteroidales bacterium]|nr:hypothetical protein [Bacteroidales bacterium]
MKRKAVEITILLFGLFYLFSGIIKIIDIDNFIYIIRSYKIKQLIYLAPAIPVIEIIIGLMLVLKIRTKLMMLFSVLLLLFFTVVFSFGHFLLNIDDCGCFGGIDFLRMSTPIFYLRNGLLIAASFYLYNNLKVKRGGVNFFKFASILLIAVAASLIVGIRSNISLYLNNIPYTKSTIDEYHNSQFLNKNVNETILSNYISTSPDSTYLVFIFSYKCPHCIISSYNLNNYLDKPTIDRVVGITKGTRKEKRLFNKITNPKFDYREIRFVEMNRITSFYPLSFYIENDTIRFKVKGTLPKYKDFEEKYFNNNNKE